MAMTGPHSLWDLGSASQPEITDSNFLQAYNLENSSTNFIGFFMRVKEINTWVSFVNYKVLHECDSYSNMTLSSDLCGF